MKTLRRNKIDFVPTILFIVSAIIWRTPYYVVGLYYFIPGVILYSFWKYHNYIFTSRFWRPSLLLLLWIGISSMVSPYSKESFSLMIPCIAAVFLSLSIFALANHKENSNLLAFAFIALFITILYSTLTDESFSFHFDYANEAERRGNTQMNSNQYAYFSLFAMIAVRLILGKQIVKYPLFRMIIYLCVGVISFFIALLTASRQVLLLQIPVLAFFIYYDFWFQGNKRAKLIGIFSALAIGLLLFPTFLEIYNNSYLSIRASNSIQEDSRAYLLMAGLIQGLENPIFGLGLGADVVFSHCTYTHLMARCGLVPLIAYVYILIIALVEQVRRYRKTKDNYFKLYAFLIFVYIVANFFYSYIDQPYMLSVLFLILGDSDKTYRNICIHPLK